MKNIPFKQDNRAIAYELWYNNTIPNKGSINESIKNKKGKIANTCRLKKMKQELDNKLVKAFPLLYGDRNVPMQSTAMCWGFPGDGWFDIIWDLSSKLEPLIQKFIDDNPLAPCGGCGCKKERHYGWKSWKPGKCLAIHVDPESEEEPPNNYFACFCDGYRLPYPRASQVKEKFGGLRFYMTCGTDEIFDLTEEAEALSYKTCEECGKPGEARRGGWIHTLCDDCHENWDKIRSKRWEEE